MDNINWSNLEDAYGPATSLPDSIKALTSSDSTLQEEALGQIWDHVWHYGRVTEATPYAIRFLIGAAAAGTLGEKLPSLLELLYYLGDGPTPWAREITNLKTYGEKAENESLALLEREENLSNGTIDAIFRQAEVYVARSHTAVRAGLPLYLDLLGTSQDPKVREICVWLTVVFPERAIEIVPRLRSHVDREQDITVKATMIWSLSRLVCDSGDNGDLDIQRDLDLFYRLAHSREHPIIYFYAAAAYCSTAKTATPPDIAARVATGIYWDWDRKDEPPPATLGPIWVSDSIQLHACRALTKLGAERAVPILLAVLKRLDESEHIETYAPFEPVIDTLLDLAFGTRNANAYRVRSWRENGKWIAAKGRHFKVEGEREAPVLHELTDLQHQVLAGLMHTEKLWTYEDNIYKLYGLPKTKEALRRLLLAGPIGSAARD
jgi:hypothetical protein